jgi:hypothetical protein
MIGLLTGFVTLSLLEYLVFVLFPLPAGIDAKSIDSLAQNMDQIPQINFILILLSFALASLVAGFVSVKIRTQNSRIPVLIIGIIFTIGGFINSMEIPQPIWMVIISSIIFIPMVYLGGRIGIGNKRKLPSY